MFELSKTMPRILIIEDDEDFNSTLCKMLKKQGYRVSSAITGHGGLHLAREQAMDLIITDIVLPDYDGLHVILDLQKDFPDVKIIAISGGGHLTLGEEYLKDVQLLSNVQHTLAKPFHKDQLFEIIDEILR